MANTQEIHGVIVNGVGYDFDTVNYDAGSGITIENNVISAKINDTLTSTAVNESLSAKQGKVLNDRISSAETGKQDKLTAGKNIVISGNTISATAEPLSGGTGINISGNVVSAVINDTLISDSASESLSAKQGKVLNEKINDIYENAFQLTGKLEFNKELPLEYNGEAISGIITWSVMKNGEAITPDTVSMKINGEVVINDPAQKTYATTFSHKKYKVIFNASKNGVTLGDDIELEIPVVVKSYFGFGNSTVSKTDFSAFDEIGLLEDISGTYAMSNTTDGKYLWICTDLNSNVGSVTSGSLEIPMEQASTAIDGYKCYRSSNAFNKVDMEILIQKHETPLSSELAFSKQIPLEYTGTAVNGNITWSVFENGEKVSPDSISLKIGSQTVPVNTGSTSYTAIFNTQGDTKILLSVEKGGKKSSTTMNIPMVVKAYFGFGGSTVTKNDFKNFEYSSLLASPKGKYELENETSYKYLWLCVDKNQVISNVRSDGFTVPMEQAITTVPNYKCYRSSNSIAAVTMNITID